MGLVVMAILAGLVGTYVVRNSLMTPPLVEAKAPTSIIVPLATTDLPAGRTLTLGDLGLMSMTNAQMVAQGFNLTQTMMDPEQIIGRTLREPVKQGQPFETTALYLEGQRRDFTADLRPGYRAVSMAIPSDRGGSLPPGSLVDMYFRSTAKPADGEQRGIPEVTLSLLQGVEIIDVYNPPPPKSSAGSGGLDIRDLGVSRTPPPPTVTFAVTPEQAQILQTTAGRGELTLVARPEDERVTNVSLKPQTLDDVLGIKPAPQVVVFATEAFRRGSRSVNVYRNDRLVDEFRNNPPANDVPTLDPINSAAPALQPAPVPAPPQPPLNPQLNNNGAALPPLPPAVSPPFNDPLADPIVP
jgi:Flp pilus assembly protein CpaB